jgi:hypothetical protein
MKSSVIVVEGPDDLAALREVFQRVLACPQSKGGRFCWPDGDMETEVLVSRSKSRIPQTVREQIARVPLPVIQVGVCFDPDKDSCDKAMLWLTAACDLPAAWDANGVCQVAVDGRTVDVVALPWDFGPIFDELEDLRNLERVALAVLARVDPTEGKLIEELLLKLRTADKRVNWKTAFRLWAAVRYADSDPDTGGAMAKVFGQDDAVRTALNAVLNETVFLGRLKRFAGTS